MSWTEPKNTFGIGTVMNAVVAGRVEHCLKGLPHRADCLSVNPELVDQVAAVHDRPLSRSESQEEDGNVEDQAGEYAQPRLAQCRREVVSLRGVMRNVTGPEEPQPVVCPVKPVVAEVIQQHEKHPRSDRGPDT